jgi:hypothetical protein
VNYSNFNTSWERRANAVEQRLGPLDGRRFGFAPVPEPKTAEDGPVPGLRPDEVQSLVAAGVIGFAAPRVSQRGAFREAPQRSKPGKRPRAEGSPGEVVRRLARSGKPFSADDVPGEKRYAVHATLSWAVRKGLIEQLQRGKPGRWGSPAVFRGVKGGKP